MKIFFNLPNIYTFVAIIYLSLGHFLSAIPILTFGFHGLFLILTFWFFILSIRECKLNKPMKVLLILFIVILVYGSWLALLGTDSSWKFEERPTRYIVTHFTSIAPVFVYYYFSEKKLINKKWFLYATPLFIFVVYQQHLFEQATFALINNLELGNFQSNTGYYFLALLPLASLFQEKRIIKYFIIIFLTIMIIISMKRGAILCAILVDFILLQESLKDKKGKIMTLIIFTFVICIISIKISDFYHSNAFFSNRIEQTLDGDKSSRDDIYNNVWTFFLNQHNLLNIIFGNGAYSSAKYIGVHAHNDWLEILISLGIFGVILYLKYWFSLLKILLISKLKIIDRSLWIGFMSIIIINFMKTLFSMSIDDMLIYSSAMFGFCLSQCNNLNTK